MPKKRKRSPGGKSAGSTSEGGGGSGDAVRRSSGATQKTKQTSNDATDFERTGNGYFGTPPHVSERNYCSVCCDETCLLCGACFLFLPMLIGLLIVYLFCFFVPLRRRSKYGKVLRAQPPGSPCSAMDNFWLEVTVYWYITISEIKIR